MLFFFLISFNISGVIGNNIGMSANVPDFIKKGDIAFMDVNYTNSYNIPGYSNDHCAIYLGHDYLDGNYFSYAGSQGVAIYSYQEIFSWLTNITFYHVNNTTKKQREDSVEWILNQTGADYQYFFPIFNYKPCWYNGMWELGTKCADPNDNLVKTSNRFYCCEMIWAGYYNNGIDLDSNGWEEKKPEFHITYGFPLMNIFWKLFGWRFPYVTCDEIINNENTTLIYSVPN